MTAAVFLPGNGLILLDGAIAYATAKTSAVTALQAIAPAEFTTFDLARLNDQVRPLSDVAWFSDGALGGTNNFEGHLVTRPPNSQLVDQRRWDAQRQVTVVQAPVDLVQRAYRVLTSSQYGGAGQVVPQFPMPPDVF